MKNKKMQKRIVVTCLSLCMLLTTLLTGCGGSGKKEGSDDDKTLHVAIVNKGYGIAWVEAMLEKFCEAKGLEYVVYPYYEDAAATQKIEAGASACNYDLVFAGERVIADSEYLLDLSDVLNSKIESGDRAGKTIAECIDETIYAGMEDEKDDGKYYRMPWTGGVNGLLYNDEVIAKALGKDWRTKYPCRTTAELLEFCAACKKAGLAPFIHSATTNYYSFLYEAWFAQYNGSEGLSDYFNARYSNFLGEKAVGYDVARNEGVLESLKVMESIFSNGYSHEKSNSIEWEVTQTYFMTGDAAMFSNGDWHHLEMMKQFPDSHIQFMKVPVISALGTKLGITDEQLAALVDYVDGKGENPNISTSEYTAEELVALVAEARSWVASYADSFNAFIPAYSSCIEPAKEFLRYMVSDEGQHIFSETTEGLTMCYGYDLSKDSIYEGLSAFAKTRWEIAKNARFYVNQRAELYARAGVKPFRANNKAPLEVLLSRDEDRYTTQMIYDYDYDYLKEQWSLIESKVNSY